MSINIRTASILHNESEIRESANYGKRVKLNLIRDNKGEYRWYTESGEDTGISASTVAEACRRAAGSWDQSRAWGFRARWFRGL